MLRSTIGKKILVALTGLILVGFVIGHLLGNLQIFLGPEAFNDYAAFLRETKGLLWGTRIVLLGSVVLHIILTVSLVRHNRASRPIGYEQKNNIQASRASRTMIYGGLFLFFYIIYHLLHFTVGSVHPDFDPVDVYENVIKGFSVWYVVVFYLGGIMALGFHLFHGAWSVFQTLGLNHPRYNQLRRTFATGLSLFVSIGYSVIPLSVLFGILE